MSDSVCGEVVSISRVYHMMHVDDSCVRQGHVLWQVDVYAVRE